MRLERTLSIKLTELEALERTQAFLLPRGYRIAGSVEEIRLKRGKFLGSFWALSPNQWPAEVVVSLGDQTQITLDVAPPNAPTDKEKMYWEQEMDAIALGISGGNADTVHGEMRKVAIQNGALVLGVAVAVGVVARFAGLVAGTISAIVLIGGLFYFLSRGRTSK